MRAPPRFLRSHAGRLLLAGALLAPAPGALLVRAAVPLTAAAVFYPAAAEARRFGGMRSFGFRGGRGLFRRPSRGFGRGYSRGYRRGGFGMGFGLPFFGLGFGFGFGLFRMLLIPLILFFVLGLMRPRR